MSQPRPKPFRITEIEEVEAARAVHRLAFPGDVFEHEDGYVHWQCVRDASKDHPSQLAAMCSGYYWPEKNALYIARVAVAKRYRGRGLMKRMLHHMCHWASREHLASTAITYTLPHNYDSIGGLLGAGFRFVNPRKAEKFVGPHVHYFAKDI